MKRAIPIILALCLLLTGCGNWLDGSYHNVFPHEDQNSQADEQIVSVRVYRELYATLVDLVAEGKESGIISVAEYAQSRVEIDTQSAIRAVMTKDPIGAYAVENIEFDLGTSGGQPAIAVTVTYLHSRAEILKIRHLEDVEQMRTAMAEAMADCSPGIVVYVQNYMDMDYDQWAADYAAVNPDKVMELPAVTANVYPKDGSQRVVELKFTYQNSRESLQNMQSKVRTLFAAAAIYAGRDGGEEEKAFKLYSFLMGLFQNFQLETSITPSYSLLQHGVGDSKAFATVYAAMCRQSGLDCVTVTGTRAGEPWYWNIVCVEGTYYHVDLLESNQADLFLLKGDADMGGYVWDFSAYPACGMVEVPEESLPEDTQPEETMPEE